MKKLNNFHHKTSSDYVSKQKTKNQLISSAVIFKTNVMNIKINNISNSREGYILLPNPKAVNGRSFDKELQENKNIVKKYLKNGKIRKDSDKNSLEIESKDKLSTNNLTEAIQYNNDNSIYLKERGINFTNNSNCNYNNYINNNINKRISTINPRNNTNGNYIPTISINIKKNDKENRIKANIDIKKKAKNKKCLYINSYNNKKTNYNNTSNPNINGNKTNETFNKVATKESFDNKIYKKLILNSYNKEKGKKHFFSNKDKSINTTEENSINKSLLPSKSKTQNYINNINYLNKNNINYYSNRKKPKNNNINDKYNNSYENININHLINSKKKLFIRKKEKHNKDNKDNKEMSGKKNKNKNEANNIKLKQKNILLLNSISVTRKLLRTKSPLNNKTITLNNDIYFYDNSTVNKDLSSKEFFTMKNNTDRQSEEGNNNTSKKFIIESVKNKNKTFSNKTLKEKNLSKTSQKHTSIKKNKSKNIISPKINNNMITITKKKNSDNNVIKKSSSNKNKKIITENIIDENFSLKNKNQNSKDIYFQNNTPLINKVLIFEIGNCKKFNNINNNSNMNNLNNSNNYSYKNIMHLDNKKKRANFNKNYFELTPKKNNITDIIKKNIKNINYIDNSQSLNNNENDSFFGENISTPINHKNSFIENQKFSEINNNINEMTNYKNKNNYIKLNEKINKSEMKTPILLNTPNLHKSIIESNLNLFEKVKNLKTKEEKTNILNNRYKDFDNLNESKDILIKSKKKNKYKNNKEYKFKHKKLINNSIEIILLLEIECKEIIFKFFDISMLNTFTLLNKKYHNSLKFIINNKIKTKILNFYKENEIKYCNKIKLSLMKFSPLSKMSPLILHKKYIDLLLEKNNIYDKEIQKDLTRTFPSNSTFKYGNSNYNKLYHLLTVYSLYNPKIGYAQGVNFLVAHIIVLFEKEEDAFVFLDALLQKFEFEKLIGVENKLENKLNNIGMYFKKYCPEIQNYLNSMNLSHEFFTTNWMITLFSNAMDDKHLFIVWDFLIIYGWKFFIYFTISVLNIYKDCILEEEQHKLTYFMKNLFKNDKFEHKFQNIIEQTFELINKDNDIY